MNADHIVIGISTERGPEIYFHGPKCFTLRTSSLLQLYAMDDEIEKKFGFSLDNPKTVDIEVARKLWRLLQKNGWEKVAE